MELTTFTPNEITNPQKRIGDAFNAAMSENVFGSYIERKAANTQTRHKQELKNFSSFLTDHKYKNDGMMTPQEWSGITFGIIEGYQRYMLNAGYSINTTNQTLYIIKAYAALAGKAGYIEAAEMSRIRDVKGFKTGEGVHIDQQRKAAQVPTRMSTKKQTARSLSTLQVERLKHEHPDTLKGKRDALILCLFLDMGLREGELLSLTAESFDMSEKVLHWHREKTNNNGHETMSRDVYAAAAEYFKAYEATEKKITPTPGRSTVSVSVNQWGQITGGLTLRGVVDIVRTAGDKVGIDHLSPHDLRHSMALRAYKAGIPLKSIQRRLGHSSVKTTERYIDIEALDRYNDFDRDF